jgi:hypothetical protein
MFQNLLISHIGRTSLYSYCLLQYVHIGYRFVRFQCFPWFVLAIAPLKLLFASGVERIRIQINYFNAIAQIDFVRVYGLLNDLLW